MDKPMEDFKVIFPDGTEYEMSGIFEGNKVYNEDGEMMFEVKDIDV